MLRTQVSQAPGGKTSINLFGGDHDEKLPGGHQQHQEENVAHKPTELPASAHSQANPSKENATPQENERSAAQPKEPVSTGEVVEPPPDSELSCDKFANGGNQNSGKIQSLRI